MCVNRVTSQFSENVNIHCRSVNLSVAGLGRDHLIQTCHRLAAGRAVEGRIARSYRPSPSQKDSFRYCETMETPVCLQAER